MAPTEIKDNAYAKLFKTLFIRTIWPKIFNRFLFYKNEDTVLYRKKNLV